MEALRSRTENQAGVRNDPELGSRIPKQEPHNTHEMGHRTYLPPCLI